MSTSLRHHSVQDFLTQLASASPTPGGGSVAALSGALAAGLIVMVCDLTIGRPRYAAFDAEAQHIRQQSEALRLTLMDLLDADVAAYTQVSAAYKLPKDDSTRSEAIATAMVTATDIPLQIAEAAAALLPLAAPVAQHGNKSAVGDVVAAAHLSVAAVRAALVNVTANMGSLVDHPRAAEFTQREQQALANLEARCAEVVTLGHARM
jgi:formiminotetrahydrofolate cyclodeaminase